MPATIYPEPPQIGSITVSNPVSGATITMASTNRSLYINNSTVLAALTIWMPPNVPSGEYVILCFANSITALSIRDDIGGPVSQAPTNAFGPGAAIELRYVDGPTGWVYWK
jgi:hypothetical protein